MTSMAEGDWRQDQYPTPSHLPTYPGNPSYSPYKPRQPPFKSAPLQRERRIITVSDPDTFSSITDDVLKSPAAPEAQQEHSSSSYPTPGRLPMYPGNPSYPPYAIPGQMMYSANSVQRPQHMPMQPPFMSAALQREKRIITVSDPDSFSSITDDVLKSPAASDAQQEDSSSLRGDSIESSPNVAQLEASIDSKETVSSSSNSNSIGDAQEDSTSTETVSAPTPPSTAESSSQREQHELKDNQNGKGSRRQYDRAFLMELRECQLSQTKPEGLPDLDIILDRPLIAPRISGSASQGFPPTLFRPYSFPQPFPGGQKSIVVDDNIQLGSDDEMMNEQPMWRRGSDGGAQMSQEDNFSAPGNRSIFEDHRSPDLSGCSVPAQTREEMESRAKNILKAYLKTKNLNEAKLCVQEMAGQKLLRVLVSSSITHVLEQNDPAKIDTGQYLYELLQAKLITKKCYMRGLGDVLESAENMTNDIPNLWIYLAQTITPILIGGYLNLIQVKAAITRYLSSRNGTILMSHVISQFEEEADPVQNWIEQKEYKEELKKEHSTADAQERADLAWMFSSEEESDEEADNGEIMSTVDDNIQLGAVMNKQPMRSRGSYVGAQMSQEDETSASGKRYLTKMTSLEDREIAFLLSPSSGVSTEQITADLEHLIRSNASNSDLIAFINRLPAGADKEKNVVRALMTSIVNASRSDFSTVEDAIKKRKDVLSKFMDWDVNLQLQALYSIQKLMSQLGHPRGLMDRIFTVLYEEDVIELEAFG